MISNSDVVHDPAADMADAQAAAALLQTVPDEPEILAESPAAEPPPAAVAPAPAAVTAPAELPPVVPPVSDGLDNIEQLAASRLAAMNAKRAARRGALPPPPATPEHPEQVKVDPGAALAFDIIEEAKKRGVDPRELALAAVNRVKDPTKTEPWKPTGIMSELEKVKAQLEEERAERLKLVDTLNLAGDQFMQTEQQRLEEQWNGQLSHGVQQAIKNEETRKQFPHVAVKNPEWVGSVAVSAFRAAQENNRSLTAAQFFAGLESELKADADSYRSLYQGSATASVAPAPAGAAPGVAPAATKVEPPSTPAAPQTQTAQGSTFKVPPELANYRFGPDDDPAAIAEAVALLQVDG